MPDESQGQMREFNPDVALQRLIRIVRFGCGVILIQGLRFGSGNATGLFNFVSVALLIGGAALLTGGLLGFLFGVPHTREGSSNQKSANTAGDSQDNAAGPSSNYRPNTSLEQISDWLTKMLVGVGLVEIKVIPGKLRDLAAYAAKGLGSGGEEETFALAIMIYFSICGFVFGFLWARLHLPRWFHEGDELRMLRAKVSLFEAQALADARASALVNKLLIPRSDDPPVAQEEVNKTIKAAKTKGEIFGRARAAANNKDVEDYQASLRGVISVLEGLIASDPNEHAYHAELFHAWMRTKSPSKYEMAEPWINSAIRIRDDKHVTGYKGYEFHRARCRIEKNFVNRPSEKSFRDEIMGDLRAAYTEQKEWKERLDKNPKVGEWLKLNGIDWMTLKNIDENLHQAQAAPAT